MARSRLGLSLIGGEAVDRFEEQWSDFVIYPRLRTWSTEYTGDARCVSRTDADNSNMTTASPDFILHRRTPMTVAPVSAERDCAYAQLPSLLLLLKTIPVVLLRREAA